MTSSLFNGQPGNVNRRVRATIKRARKYGLVPTFTTNGTHSLGSWHKPWPGRNRLGAAVDLGFTRRDFERLTPEQRRGRLIAFQLAEYRFAKRMGFHTFQEILGPDNEYVLLKGGRTDLVEGTPLETMHESHVHIARPGR